MDNTEQKSTQKAWKAGTNTIVVTIPKNIQNIQNIQEGDYLEITYKLIKKKEAKTTRTGLSLVS